MDQQTEQRLDAIVEDEVRRGYRIKALPESLQQELQANGGPDIQRVRFTRLNPARRRKIAEVVQRQYHRDLRNPDILSHEQILKLVEERGEWSKDLAGEMDRLAQSTKQQMGILFANGGSTSAAAELLERTREFRDWVDTNVPQEEQEEVHAIFNRWLEYTPEQQEEYTRQYAELQDRERYSNDKDFQTLQLRCTDIEVRTTLLQLDELREKTQQLIQLQKDRIRLLELQIKHAKIFSESVEQRRDNTEEMARMYFTTERVDEQDVPQGPVVKTFEEMWDLPENVVQWLMIEAYFFQNGIPDDAREYLESFGFLKAERESTVTPSTTSESVPSDGSPVPPTSRPDSEGADSTPAVSLEPRMATI